MGRSDRAITMIRQLDKNEEAASNNESDSHDLSISKSTNSVRFSKHIKNSSVLEMREPIPMSANSMRNKSPGTGKKNGILNRSELCRNGKEKTEFYNSLVHVC